MASSDFLAACRKVLGDDSPATVLGAMRDRDPRMCDVYALTKRDPSRWLCCATNKHTTHMAWAKGDSEAEARKRAELAVTDFRDSKQSYRDMEARSEWTFVVYPPDAASN